MAIGTPVAGTLAENATATTSLAVPYPAGISAGDLLLMWVAVSVATVPALPAGWTSIVSGSSGTGSQSPSNRWYYKVATGSETGNQSVTHSNATSRGQMWRISGVDQTTPIDVVGTHTAAAIGAATTHPGVTTTVTGAQVWASAMKNSSGGTYPTVTSPFTMTEVLDDGTPYPTVQVSYLTWSGSGATGTVTFGTDTSVRAGYDVLALRPAADSVTGSAAVTAPAVTASGSGTLTITGSADATAPAAAATATGDLTVTGAGATAGPAAQAAGAGTLTVTGTGASSAVVGVVAGTGVLTVTGTGAVTAPPATASGAGGGTAVTGSAAMLAPAATASASGTLTITGTGSASAPPATVAAAAGLLVAVVLALVAPPATATGTGSVTDPSVPTPPERRMTIPAESRRMTIPAESRVLVIPTESRVLTIPTEPRVLEVR